MPHFCRRGSSYRCNQQLQPPRAARPRVAALHGDATQLGNDHAGADPAVARPRPGLDHTPALAPGFDEPMTAVASVHDANVEQHPKERQKICVRVVRPKRRATQLDAQVVRMVHARLRAPAAAATPASRNVPCTKCQ